MKVKFIPKAEPDRKADFLDLLLAHPRRALIFSRLENHGEVIAIVPTSKRDDPNRHWVWLSSHEDGAYLDGEARSPEQVAGTLAFGEWNYQPDATIHLTGGLRT